VSTIDYELSIVIPTYNEVENMRRLIPYLSTTFKEISHEMIVVDDQSTDGTPEAILELAKAGHSVRLISKEKKEGIGAALRVGYDQSNGSFIASMDADLSFKPEDLKVMFQKIRSGRAGLVLGNRHSRQSFYEAVKPSVRIKRWVSSKGNWFLRTVTRIPIGDFSANFRLIRKEAWQKGYEIDQVPVSFIDRRFGKSKLNLFIEIPKFLFKLWGYLIRYGPYLYGRPSRDRNTKRQIPSPRDAALTHPPRRRESGAY
jgi:dolichol-phosphate mannosyltransferase